MTKKLILLRHAKSSWNDAALSDFDRPLNKRGLRDAPDMANRLQARGCVPDKVLCSPAKRTQETAEIIFDSLQLNKQRLEYVDTIYEASPGDLMAAIAQQDDATIQLMIIGHNPALEYLASMLNQGDRLTMATCAVCEFDIDENACWKDFTAARIELAYHDFPKNV